MKLRAENTHHTLMTCTTATTHLFWSAVYWYTRAKLLLIDEASHEPVVNGLAQQCEVTLKANVSKTKYVVVDLE